ncbi:DUF2637 domain-containing protein [Nonomuraea basaltis]|uniref:DUF2637 domain-containing protein n=1 Tax=Nonomuraea basaltis TaxID=2495887 RepID=UPI00110C4907|nr:DUF2637 domain-containing protein [Nonomuraea basaltis]TMR97513.1 DUF2637 domain-containing protein [Nonomuraea basaltis]
MTPSSRTPSLPSRVLPTLSAAAQRLAIVVIAGVALLGLIGFVVSFGTVAEAAHPRFGVFSFLVPVGIDLGILVFSALDILLARLNMRLAWLRLIPWSLAGATIYLNVAGAADLFGMVAHAALPLLWVVGVEIGAHVARVWAGVAAGTRMDGIRVSRWLLAPRSTFLLWRRMVLWEVRSYPAALHRERDRVLAKTDLQDAHGWLGYGWRFRATRRQRALYRLGELAPAVHADQMPIDLDGSTPARLDPSTSAALNGSTRSRVNASVPSTPNGSTRRPGPNRGSKGLSNRAKRRRTLDELRAEFDDARAAGQLNPTSAESIRKTLECAPDSARLLRDEYMKGNQP